MLQLLKQQSFTGLTEAQVQTIVLAMEVARFDANFNLIDPDGVVRSGVTSGTHAAMMALSPVANFENTYFLATNYGQDGLLYKCDGTNWRLAGRSAMLHLLSAPISYIAPATAATAAATNGGNTQITAAAHTLTTSPAVGSKVNVSAWGGGTPVAATGLHEILSVDSVNTYTINVPYNAANGTPTVTLANNQVTLLSVDVPPLLSNSRIKSHAYYGLTASANSKRMIMKLGSDEMTNVNETTAGDLLCSIRSTISNIGSVSVQQNAYLKTATSDNGGSGATLTSGTTNTGNASVLYFDVLPAAANEVIALNSLDIELVI